MLQRRPGTAQSAKPGMFGLYTWHMFSLLCSYKYVYYRDKRNHSDPTGVLPFIGCGSSSPDSRRSLSYSVSPNARPRVTLKGRTSQNLSHDFARALSGWRTMSSPGLGANHRLDQAGRSRRRGGSSHPKARRELRSRDSSIPSSKASAYGSDVSNLRRPEVAVRMKVGGESASRFCVEVCVQAAYIVPVAKHGLEALWVVQAVAVG